jgi:anthranilate synthase/aminodeoxychorismate synthase-like glutamine amidotransferase
MSQLLIIDNYDSFTYTINHYFNHLGKKTKIIKNDDDLLLHLNLGDYSHIVLSPGPGHPKESNHMLHVIEHYHPYLPILGICLGHQAIMHVFGGNVIHAPQIMHGKLSKIKHIGQGIFEQIPNGIRVTRYHSLAVDSTQLPPNFKITAWTDDSEEVVMAFEHELYPLYGVQYHPEAIMTEYGYTLFQNFLKNT